jgi:hypothetical protein
MHSPRTAVRGLFSWRIAHELLAERGRRLGDGDDGGVDLLGAG